MFAVVLRAAICARAFIGACLSGDLQSNDRWRETVTALEFRARLLPPSRLHWRSPPKRGFISSRKEARPLRAGASCSVGT